MVFILHPIKNSLIVSVDHSSSLCSSDSSESNSSFPSEDEGPKTIKQEDLTPQASLSLNLQEILWRKMWNYLLRKYLKYGCILKSIWWAADGNCGWRVEITWDSEAS